MSLTPEFPQEILDSLEHHRKLLCETNQINPGYLSHREKTLLFLLETFSATMQACEDREINSAEVLKSMHKMYERIILLEYTDMEEEAFRNCKPTSEYHKRLQRSLLRYEDEYPEEIAFPNKGCFCRDLSPDIPAETIKVLKESAESWGLFFRDDVPFLCSPDTQDIFATPDECAQSPIRKTEWTYKIRDAKIVIIDASHFGHILISSLSGDGELCAANISMGSSSAHYSLIGCVDKIEYGLIGDVIPSSIGRTSPMETYKLDSKPMDAHIGISGAEWGTFITRGESYYRITPSLESEGVSLVPYSEGQHVRVFRLNVLVDGSIMSLFMEEDSNLLSGSCVPFALREALPNRIKECPPPLRTLLSDRFAGSVSAGAGD